jgi:hypothetical protein
MRSVRTRVKAGPMRGANFYQPRLGGSGPLGQDNGRRALLKAKGLHSEIPRVPAHVWPHRSWRLTSPSKTPHLDTMDGELPG